MKATSADRAMFSKQYWARIHAIQGERNCDVAEAKLVYAQNGKHKANGGGLTGMGIEEIFTYAALKVTELNTEMSGLEDRLAAIKQEIGKWQRIRSVEPTPFDAVEAMPA